MPGELPRPPARLGLVYAGRPAPIPADRAFADAVRRFAIPRAVPEALIEGLSWDAAGRRYEDLDALAAYAARVAGTVGVMMALVMGVRAPAAVARACDLGVAMQLTNIVRDVGEDARAGRLYLPLAWLREAGIDPAAWLRAPVADAALAGVLRRVLAAADALYARAEAGIGRLPADCRPAIRAASLLYAEIGREVERRGLDPVSGRAVVARGRKLRLLARALRLRPPPACPDGPPLPAARFLVDAVAAAPAPAAPPPPAWWRLTDRAAQVLDLFLRLERRDAVQRSGTGP